MRNANLPETRAEEFLGAAQEIVRNYQLAVNTLTAVLDKEAQQLSASTSESIPLPKNDAEADALRDKLAGLRTQAQTVSSQVQIDEEFLARQQSALKAAGQQLRRAQEEFDAASTDATRNRAALPLRLAELQQEAASSAVFLASWRHYADQLDLRASQAEVRGIEQALSASGLDRVFNEKRTLAAIERIEKEKASVLEQIKSAQSARQALDDAIAPLEQDLQKVSDAEDRERLEARLAVAREANDFANRIATAGQAWLEGLDEALRLWKATLAVAENPGPRLHTLKPVSSPITCSPNPTPGVNRLDATSRTPEDVWTNSSRNRNQRTPRRANSKSRDSIWCASASPRSATFPLFSKE